MKVIVSTNEDPKYFGFWPYVAKAYKLMGYEPHLAFLTWRKENDPIVTELRQHGEVTLFEPNGLAPEFGQAKMIRFLLASEQGEKVCYVEDIDLIPLSKDFIESKVSQRPKDTLLCVGGEVYGHNGCYPISQMTAEGYIWKRFINPNDLSLHDLVEYEWGKDGQYDEKENIFTQPTRNFDKYFSDEKLMRRLLTENPVPKHEMERGYGRVLDHTIDRMNWQIDYDKLIKDGYVNAHCQRPINVPDTETLLNYLHDKYSQDIQTN